MTTLFFVCSLLQISDQIVNTNAFFSFSFFFFYSGRASDPSRSPCGSTGRWSLATTNITSSLVADQHFATQGRFPLSFFRNSALNTSLFAFPFLWRGERERPFLLTTSNSAVDAIDILPIVSICGRKKGDSSILSRLMSLCKSVFSAPITSFGRQRKKKKGNFPLLWRQNIRGGHIGRQPSSSPLPSTLLTRVILADSYVRACHL